MQCRFSCRNALANHLVCQSSFSVRNTMLVKMQCHLSCVAAVSPYGLCRRTIEVGGVHLVAYGRDYLHHAYSCLRQCIEQLVASVAWLVYADVVFVGAWTDCYHTRLGLQLHPLHSGEIALELRIVEALSRHGVVVVVCSHAKLRTVYAVFPHSVRTASEPLLMLHFCFRQVELHSHQIYHPIEDI